MAERTIAVGNNEFTIRSVEIYDGSTVVGARTKEYMITDLPVGERKERYSEELKSFCNGGMDGKVCLLFGNVCPGFKPIDKLQQLSMGHDAAHVRRSLAETEKTAKCLNQ